MWGSPFQQANNQLSHLQRKQEINQKTTALQTENLNITTDPNEQRNRAWLQATQTNILALGWLDNRNSRDLGEPRERPVKCWGCASAYLVPKKSTSKVNVRGRCNTQQSVSLLSAGTGTEIKALSQLVSVQRSVRIPKGDYTSGTTISLSRLLVLPPLLNQPMPNDKCKAKYFHVSQVVDCIIKYPCRFCQST